VPNYLVERYLPGLSADEVHTAIRRQRTVVKQMTADGTTIRYLSAAYIAEEQSRFCQLAAPSRDAVIAANQRATIPFARILDVEPEKDH
jgi:hypothetical protein